jgi:hypothetical protein
VGKESVKLEAPSDCPIKWVALSAAPGENWRVSKIAQHKTGIEIPSEMKSRDVFIEFGKFLDIQIEQI